ncbi:unnamed protein product [Adineta steineri]|uniref:Nuclear receptor domain-containing protein n=1 Tax=Adineta steineri TaxID=433720 RepID=A0A813XD12_9BILA|nr:unnamed protein product [Adineta steineri]CAF3694042.1 unnamed protein product [Adineta steineri]
MDSDKRESFVVPKNPTADVQSSNICKVCGDETTVTYLGISCCSSCKMFFRRNVELNLDTQHCVFTGNCDINVNSRGACRYCRLKKCFFIGLQKDLLRSSFTAHSYGGITKKQKTSTNEITVALSTVIPTLDLLINDRSLLSFDQWCLLSNVTHSYDDQSPILAIQNKMASQLNYPAKIRMKMATDYFKYIASSLYLSAGPFFKTMPEVVHMSTSDQGILIERNIRSMSGFGAILVLRETDLCQNPYYHNASMAVYGHELTHQAMKIVQHADTDGTLIKLMVPILALSTCSDIIDPNYHESVGSTLSPGGTRLFPNTLHLLILQNIYVEMMFKYMLYRYGFKEAVLRFAGLIKTCIDQNLMVCDGEDLRQHDEMVHSITEQTERLLV